MKVLENYASETEMVENKLKECRNILDKAKETIYDNLC